MLVSDNLGNASSTAEDQDKAPLTLDEATEKALQLFEKPAEQGAVETVSNLPSGQSQEGEGEKPVEGTTITTENKDNTDSNGLILGKFKSVEDLAEAYRNAERALTQTRQELAAKEAQALSNNQLQPQTQDQPVGQIGGNPEQPQQPEQPIDGEAFLNEFYANPINAIGKIVQQAVAQAVKPIAPVISEYEDKARWTDRAAKFLQSHPDAQELAEDIVKVLNEKPHIQNFENAYDLAYEIAKERASRNITPESLLSDNEFVEKYIINNPDISDKIINQHIQKVKASSNTPPLIGTSGGGTLATPANKPKGIEDASAMLLERLNKATTT